MSRQPKYARPVKQCVQLASFKAELQNYLLDDAASESCLGMQAQSDPNARIYTIWPCDLFSCEVKLGIWGKSV
jgi:hypothetical protein